MLLLCSRRQRYQTDIILNVVDSLLEHRIGVITQEYNVLARRRSLFEENRLAQPCVSSHYTNYYFHFFRDFMSVYLFSSVCL